VTNCQVLDLVTQPPKLTWTRRSGVASILYSIIHAKLAVDSGQLWDETIVKERKKGQEMLWRVLRVLPVALDRIKQRVWMVPCRVNC
jgi:hypothetical protein